MSFFQRIIDKISSEKLNENILFWKVGPRTTKGIFQIRTTKEIQNKNINKSCPTFS
jgi:hypothetical protein